MGQQLAEARKDFLQSWEKSEQSIIANLPSNIDASRFRAVALRAVQEDPALMHVDDKMSLFLACQRAAADGLMPDKREGALVVFRRKQGDNWMTGVQWMPMIGGIRKRVAKCGFDLQAKVIHKGDHFEYQEGDDPKIVHIPAKLGTDRGPMIGAYAIARDFKTGAVYREVMDAAAIEKVKRCAKTPTVWNAWPEEQWRKTVARRLSKSLPIGDETEDAQRFWAMIARENEHYDPEKAVPTASEKAAAAQKAAREKVSVLPFHGNTPEEPKQPTTEETGPEDIDGELVGDDDGFSGTEPGF